MDLPAEIVAVEVVAPTAPLVQPLVVELDRGTPVEVLYWGPDDERPLRVASEAVGATHDITLYRLRAAMTYQYEVVSVAGDGTRGDPVGGEFTTEPLPDELAALQIETTGTASFPLLMMEVSIPGLTGVPVIMDAEGHIVWYRPGATARTHGIGVLPGVGFAINSIDEGVEVVTPEQDVIASLTEADAAARTGLGEFDIHHDVTQASETSLHLLVLDTATVDGTVWTGEAIWEWDWVDDRLEKRWSSFDFMSPATDVGARSRPADWLHANSITVGPRGNILMSLFWTHEVVSIASDFQSLEWRLGGPASSFTVLDGAMEAGQHTAYEVEPNRVLLFDNGLDRPGGEQFSRATEVEIDPVAGTAAIAWEYRPDPTVYAPIVGSTTRLENGNTVVTFGVAGDALAQFPDAGPLGVHEATPSGDRAWLATFEGIGLLYRAVPLETLGGEVRVGGQ